MRVVCYLVSLVGIGRSDLALVAGRELGEITVVVTLPARQTNSQHVESSLQHRICTARSHLMVEHSGLARPGVGDEGGIENLEDILADALELGFDLLTVFRDDGDVLVRTLGVLLLLDGGDDAPRGTTGANDVLVRDREEVALIDGEFSTDLEESACRRRK